MENTDVNIRPKGPLTPYTCFVCVIRDEHQRKYPDLNYVFSEFAKLCAEKWKLMTIEEKKIFDEMAQLDKERYQAEISEFPLKFASKAKKRKRVKDPSRPKRALSAFFFFCDEFRPEVRKNHPEWRVSEVAKELGKLWEICTDRTKYESQSLADRRRYEEDMKTYNSQNSNEKGLKETDSTVISEDIECLNDELSNDFNNKRFHYEPDLCERKN